MHDLTSGYAEARKGCQARNLWSVMLRDRRIAWGKLQTPGVRENFVHRTWKAVPRTDTGALVEKTKACKVETG